MAEEKNNNSNLAAKSAQAANTVRGAVKTGKAIAGAAKGAAAGGPYGAVAGLVWGNRHLIGKIILITVFIMLLPVLFILMLPALIFGGLVDAFTPDDPTVPVLNDSAYITENMTDITNSVSDVLSEALEDVLVEIEDGFSSSGADQQEIINPHENAPAYNANAFVSQLCASKNEDFESITFADMESTLRSAKGELYSFTSKEETRTRVETTVTVDASTGKETETSTTVTEDWMVYKIKKIRFIGMDSWRCMVFEDESGKLWKYTEPGEHPMERHDRLYSSTNNALDGEPCWPMMPDIDYQIEADNQDTK